MLLVSHIKHDNILIKIAQQLYLQPSRFYLSDCLDNSFQHVTLCMTIHEHRPFVKNSDLIPYKYSFDFKTLHPLKNLKNASY